MFAHEESTISPPVVPIFTGSTPAQPRSFPPSFGLPNNEAPRDGTQTPPPSALHFSWGDRNPHTRNNAFQDFSGAYYTPAGDLLILQQECDVVSVVNPEHSLETIPAHGSVCGDKISMYGLVGVHVGDNVHWSDGSVWINTSGVDISGRGKFMGEPDMPPEMSDTLLVHGLIPIKGVWVLVPSEMAATFPVLFSFFCFTLFAVPLVLLFYVTSDVNIDYWVSSGFNNLWLITFPIFFVFVHIIQACSKRPSKFLTVLAIVGTGGFCLIISDVMMMTANARWIDLASADCDTFKLKRTMQESWQAADDLYIECLSNESAITGESVADLQEVMRLSDCSTYATEAESYPDWSYLSALESALECSGWCTYQAPLWTFGTTKDSCSSSVSVILRDKGEVIFFQVAVYSIVVLCFATLALVVAGNVLRRSGIDW